MMHPVKAAIWSAIASVAVVSAVEFNWLGIPGLGFYTAGGAERLAVAREHAALTPYVVADCVEKFKAQPTAVVAAKRKALENANYTYAREQQFEPAWVKFPGEHSTSDELVEACAKGILESGKSAAIK